MKFFEILESEILLDFLFWVLEKVRVVLDEVMSLFRVMGYIIVKFNLCVVE